MQCTHDRNKLGDSFILNSIIWLGRQNDPSLAAVDTDGFGILLSSFTWSQEPVAMSNNDTMIQQLKQGANFQEKCVNSLRYYTLAQQKAQKNK